MSVAWEGSTCSSWDIQRVIKVLLGREEPAGYPHHERKHQQSNWPSIREVIPKKVYPFSLNSAHTHTHTRKYTYTCSLLNSRSAISRSVKGRTRWNKHNWSMNRVALPTGGLGLSGQAWGKKLDRMKPWLRWAIKVLIWFVHKLIIPNNETVQIPESVRDSPKKSSELGKVIQRVLLKAVFRK